jgi:cyclopropane fatty-acyl-phospholipid synthase-like methyltransferase
MVRESSPRRGYVFDGSPEDQQRLIRSSEALGALVTEACRRAGLAAGSHVIEIGCGPLGALPPLADVVGPTGRVVGLDASGEALARARAILDG